MGPVAFNPLEHPVCLEYPLRLAPSTWTQHVPFAMYLVDVLRPRMIVELGTHYGVSYCAFCQAVKRLESDTRCYAIDTWHGDVQAGFYGPEVFDDLRRHHDPLYGAFSQLVQSTFDDALDQFQDQSIDLLHFDGCHTYESVKHDFSRWLPKVSHAGVVLLHDIGVRRNDFGVWRLWDEVKRDFRSFELLHGYGLGVAFVGPVPHELAAILDSPESHVTSVREFFFTLGSRLQCALDVELMKATIGDQSCMIANLQKRLRAFSTEADET